MLFLENTIFPSLQKSGGSALIFVKTKRTAASLYQTLAKAGAPIVCLHGDMDQRGRDSALYAFKNGKAKVLVATDVAQRGLDIRSVQCVVNFDPPANMEDYVHRIGRTGRAGDKGDAYTCLYESEKDAATKIMQVMRKTGQEIPQELKDICNGAACQLNGQWGGRYANDANKADQGGSWDNWSNSWSNNAEWGASSGGGGAAAGY